MQREKNMTSLVPFPPLPSANLPEFDISDLLQDVCDALERESLRRRVPIEVDAPPYTMVRGDRRQLRGLLIRLLGNALSASPAGSQIVVTTYSNQDGVEVEVADDRSESVELLLGEGLSAGAGDARPLSWSEVQQIAAGCGAQVSVADCPDSGVAMTVHFPRLTGTGGGSRKAA
jgi:signal transduction histidine kinase